MIVIHLHQLSILKHGWTKRSTKLIWRHMMDFLGTRNKVLLVDNKGGEEKIQMLLGCYVIFNKLLCASWLIVCHVACWMIKFIILFTFPYNLFILFFHVFGCTCLVHNLKPKQDKLFVKATKCMFLEYPKFQNGHSWYSLDKNRCLQLYHRVSILFM